MGLFSFVKAGKKVFDTVKSVKPNVGNLKKNKETIKKLTDMTDKYVKTANEKGFKDLAKDLRKSGSKSLQKTDKILRKGGRKNLKFGGGADAGKIPTTPKEKKFAAIAEPKNRITYRDKIEGAKKRG